MSGRGPMFESLSEFVDRRLLELVKLPKFAKMNALEVVDIIEAEFYDCANDPIPPEPDDRAGATLQ